jgi:hypothetical protein
MSSHKTLSLFTACAGIGALSVSGSAQAVNVTRWARAKS